MHKKIHTNTHVTEESDFIALLVIVIGKHAARGNDLHR